MHHHHSSVVNAKADNHFAVPRLHISVAVLINITVGGGMQTWVLSHCS